MTVPPLVSFNGHDDPIAGSTCCTTITTKPARSLLHKFCFSTAGLGTVESESKYTHDTLITLVIHSQIRKLESTSFYEIDMCPQKHPLTGAFNDRLLALLSRQRITVIVQPTLCSHRRRLHTTCTEVHIPPESTVISINERMLIPFFPQIPPRILYPEPVRISLPLKKCYLRSGVIQFAVFRWLKLELIFSIESFIWTILPMERLLILSIVAHRASLIWPFILMSYTVCDTKL